MDAPVSAVVEPPGFFQASYNFFDIDFANRNEWVRIQIDPGDAQVNRGKPIQLSFIPGNTCNFGDSRVCVNIHNNGTHNMVFLTVHSGVGGEAQAFRHAIEGTGINRAGYAVTKVQDNLNALAGTDVAISQGNQQFNGFSLVGVTRIHPSYVHDYLGMSIDQALAFATQLDPALMAAIDPSRPVLVFETCGWKMPGEPWYPGISATTGSIYVGVIQNLP